MEQPRSKQGRAVLAAVRLLDHPGADQIFAHVRQDHPRISLATVYRNLDALANQGLIRRRDIGGNSRYDANTTKHLHLHDMQTDQLKDIPISPGLQLELDAICRQHFQGQTDCVIEIKGNLKP